MLNPEYYFLIFPDISIPSKHRILARQKPHDQNNPIILRILAKSLVFLLLLSATTACLPDWPDAAARYEVSGVDVSHYQGAIDWDALAADGHDFAFIKATEGKELKDKAFFANWTLAGKTGMRRGAYHFFRPEVTPEDQARNFFAAVELAPGDLPPVIDVEDRGKLSPTQLIAGVKQMADMVELRYGVKPIIYTGQNFYNRFLAGQFDDYPLWLARYDTEEPVTVCGRAFEFWQFTDRAKLPGVVGHIDRNVFTGSHLDLVMLCIPPTITGNEDLAGTQSLR